jgi:O-antigen ligase|nr:O-antigen ligase family protein [uncultured Acetatifactor sp.]
MKSKISGQMLKYLILLIIPFFIFVAIEGTFSIQSILPVILLLLFADLTHRKIKKQERMLIVVGLFLLSTCVSLVYNALVGTGLTTSRTYIRIIYYLVILYFYFSLTGVKYTNIQLEKIFTANIICGALVAMYLIVVNHIWFVGLLGTRVDKNFVGAILAVQGEIALIKFLKTDKPLGKLFAIVSYIIILLGIFYSASRASVLVVILGTSITIFFRLIEKRNTKRGFIKLLFIFLATIVSCIVAFSIVAPRMSNASASIRWYWNRYFVNGFGDASVTGRVVWWKEALVLWLNRLLCGYGIGNVNVSGNSSAVAHNTYIDFLLDQGILGFAGFLVILHRSISKIIRKRNSIYYGIIVTVLLSALILSATRSTFLWYNMVILWCIGNAANELK